MKKKKTKYYIKNNLIGLIIGGIIFGSLGVYAAITFPSNEVSFDPSNSTLKSTNVKDAIDELYKKCTQTASEQIIDVAGLTKDPNECRYFFTGANPNNYIMFGDNQGFGGYRILSVECDGTIKVIYDNRIDNMDWDENGNNDWTTASLNTYLNTTFYNSDYLSDAQRNLIVSHDFSVGELWHNGDDSTIRNFINRENAKHWNGKIALMTVSEYLRTNSDFVNCGNNIYRYNFNREKCKNNTYIYSSYVDRLWFLSPATGNLVWRIDSLDDVDDYNPAQPASIKPVFYISPDVKLISGDGSISNPFYVTL